jgi:hypothetical protein
MFNLFKNLRKQVIQESKIKRYLLYAVGEILLVVIGILIALQINTANERSKNNKEEERILQNIRLDLGKDTSQLVKFIENTAKQTANIDTLVDILNQESDYDIAKFVRLGLENLGYERYFKVNSGTFDESIASGSIKLIKNDGLRQSIFEYYKEAKLNYTDENTLKQIYEDMFPVLFQKFIVSKEIISNFYPKTRMPKLDLYELGKDVEFISMIMQKQASMGFQSRDWKKFIDKAKRLNEQIVEELN